MVSRVCPYRQRFIAPSKKTPAGAYCAPEAFLTFKYTKLARAPDTIFGPGVWFLCTSRRSGVRHRQGFDSFRRRHLGAEFAFPARDDCRGQAITYHVDGGTRHIHEGVNT